MEGLKSFLKRVKSMEREEFLQFCTDPVLATGMKKMAKKKEEDNLLSEDTTRIRENVVQSVVEGAWAKPGWVIPLKTRHSSTPISIGNSPQASITLPLPTLSPIHGHFSQKDGQLVFVDNDSKVGTYHGDKKVEAGREIELQSGDTLRFGDNVLFEFYLPSDFYQAIQNLEKNS